MFTWQKKTTSLCYVSFYVRCSVFQLGYVSFYVRCLVLDLPKCGSPVLCTCTADIVLQCSPFSDVHARGTNYSFFGTASCMSCFGYFVSWLISFRLCWDLLSQNITQWQVSWPVPFDSFACVDSFIYEKCADFRWNTINNGKADGISFSKFSFSAVEASFYGILKERWSLSWPVSFDSFSICLCSPFHLRKHVLILFGFRSIRISLPLQTVCEKHEFTFLTVRLTLYIAAEA